MDKEHFRPDFANMTPVEKSSYWRTKNRVEKYFKNTGINLEILKEWCEKGYPMGLKLTDNEKTALKEFAEGSELTLKTLAEKLGVNKTIYNNRLISGGNKIRHYIYPRIYRKR